MKRVFSLSAFSAKVSYDIASRTSKSVAFLVASFVFVPFMYLLPGEIVFFLLLIVSGMCYLLGAELKERAVGRILCDVTLNDNAQSVCLQYMDSKRKIPDKVIP